MFLLWDHSDSGAVPALFAMACSMVPNTQRVLRNHQRVSNEWLIVAEGPPGATVIPLLGSLIHLSVQVSLFLL